jgi:HAD superfamily hydrolase (TIGR01509 family)
MKNNTHKKPPLNINTIDHWIFDLDGTLTVAAHDFDKIRHMLGLPKNKPILEVLETYPEDQAQQVLQNLEKIEHEIAKRAQPQKDTHEVLTKLTQKKVKLGIITRNNLENARETLKNSGLHNFFQTDYIIDRHSCKPKPDPEGVLKLLRLWKALPENTVVVGDYKFDLIAGREAGVYTLYLDIPGDRKWEEYADMTVDSFASLIRYLNL